MLERFHVSKWLTRENVEKNTQLFQLLNELERWSVSQKEQYWDSRYFQWMMNGVRRPGTKTQSFVFIPSSFWTSMVTCSYLMFQIRHMQIQIKCERTYNTIQFNNNNNKKTETKKINLFWHVKIQQVIKYATNACHSVKSNVCFDSFRFVPYFNNV